MIFYIDLRPKDGSNSQCFRTACYAFLRTSGFAVVDAGKNYSKVNTDDKTAVDTDTLLTSPAVTEKTSWTVLRTFINS